MTPEERAAAILQFARTMPHSSRFIRNVAAQIREAEQAATERAAGIVMKEGMFLTKLEYCEYLAHKIRAKE